jgi:O-antigen/teichoic acid export membrane protein
LLLLLSMATSVVLVRVLTKADYGAFAYALTLVAGARVLLSLGQGRLLSRFMATYEERRDYPACSVRCC